MGDWLHENLPLWAITGVFAEQEPTIRLIYAWREFSKVSSLLS